MKAFLLKALENVSLDIRTIETALVITVDKEEVHQSLQSSSHCVGKRRGQGDRCPCIRRASSLVRGGGHSPASEGGQ